MVDGALLIHPTGWAGGLSNPAVKKSLINRHFEHSEKSVLLIAKDSSLCSE